MPTAPSITLTRPMRGAASCSSAPTPTSTSRRTGATRRSTETSPTGCAITTAMKRPPKRSAVTDETLLWLGHRRRRLRCHLHRSRRDAVARRLSAADVGGDGLVTRRDLDGGVAELPVHGCGIVIVGRAVRLVWGTRGRAVRRRVARRRLGVGKPGGHARPVPAALRRRRRARGGQFFCTADRGDDTLVHRAPQPC